MSALLAGLILFCTGAIAYRLSQRKLWVSLAVVLMTAAAMGRITDDLWLRHPDFKWPDDATNLFNHAGDKTGAPYDASCRAAPITGPRTSSSRPLLDLDRQLSFQHGRPIPRPVQRALPRGNVQPAPTNWPWIGPLLASLILLVSSTWSVPIAGTFFLAGTAWCAWRGIHPRDWRFVARLVAAAVICLTPMLIYFLRVGMPSSFMPPEGPTPLLEFLLQWWPVYIPWLLLFFWWRRTHPAVRILQILLPLFFLGLEHFNLEARIDTTGKLWGSLFAAGWAAFVPSLLALRSWTCAPSSPSSSPRPSSPPASGRLLQPHDPMAQRRAAHRGRRFPDRPGQGPRDERRQLGPSQDHHHRAGPCTASTDDPLLASLTYNRSYIAWNFTTRLSLEPDTFDDADTRDADVNNLMNGKLPNPLNFLLTKNIWMVVIWPDHNIDPAVVTALQPQLAPAYTYIDWPRPPPRPQGPTRRRLRPPRPQGPQQSAPSRPLGPR